MAKSLSIKSASLAVVGSALLMSATSQAAELITPVDDNNGQSGIMFDVVVGAQDLVFEALTVRTTARTGNWEFYTRSGGIAGNQNNAGAWTLRDTFINNVSSPTFTIFNISDILAAANSTVGFYFTFTTPGGEPVRYRNGTGVGNVRASNADLTILEGFGKAYPFATNFQPRAFVGSISYSVASAPAVPEPATWAMMILGFGFVGGAMRSTKRRQKVTFSFA